LQTIDLYATDATGNISNNFASLPNLTTLDIRFTRVGGPLADNSFTGNTSLRNIYIASSSYSTNDFFGNTGSNNGEVFYETPNLQNLYVYNNSNIAGELPDFSRNLDLRVIYIRNTSISGSIPLFSENTNLYYIRLDNNKFTSFPAFRGSNFKYIYVNGNEITGVIQELECTNLLRLYAGYNQISGTIPTFANCSNIQYLALENNSITNFARGTVDQCTRLRFLDLSNNNLSESSAINIISDLVDNYTNNPRSGVVVNLLGNSKITEQFILSNEIAAEQLSFLRNNARWSINI
jgi:Leucine-rich repeat (LRR) protein